MPITVSSRDSALTIALSGEIDHHAARELMAQLDQAIAERLPAQLVLDMSGVAFMDSSGIAVLLRAHRRMGQVQGAMLVVNTPAQAEKVFRAAGLERITGKEGKQDSCNS